MRTRFSAPVVALLSVLAAFPLSGQMAQVAGEWEMEWETPRGAQTITINFEQDGGTLTGDASMVMMQNREMQMEVEGTVDGQKVTFTFAFAPPQGGGGRGGAGGGGGAGRGGAGGGGGRAGGGPGGMGNFSFAGDFVSGELRGKLTPPRGEAMDVVLKRPTN